MFLYIEGVPLIFPLVLLLTLETVEFFNVVIHLSLSVCVCALVRVSSMRVRGATWI